MTIIPSSTRQVYDDLKRQVDEERRSVEEARSELAAREASFARFDGAARALEAAYPGLVVSSVEPSEERTPAGPTGIPKGSKTAVLTLLGQHLGEWFLIGRIVKDVVDLGWLPGSYEDNTNRVRVATSRLAGEGRIESRRSGRAHEYRSAPTEGGGMPML
jgi:Tfp pilus assembly protein FimV